MKEKLLVCITSCLLGVAVTSCLLSPEVSRHKFQDREDRLLYTSPSWHLYAPTSDGGKCLRRMAIEGSRQFQDREDRLVYIAGFECFFMEVLRGIDLENCGADYWPTNDPYRVGAEDGVALGRLKRDRAVDIPSLDLTRFGYTLTNVIGKIFLASECAVIRFDNGASWWIENDHMLPDDIEWDEKKYGAGVEAWDIERTSQRRIAVVGYVSPVGGYGHMGLFERGIVIEKCYRPD